MPTNRGKHYQYPANAEPTFSPPPAVEDITLDKWYAPLSEPRFPRYYLLVGEPEVSRQIPAVPDMAGWYVQDVRVPAPRNRTAALLASGLTFVPEPEAAAEEVTLEKWFSPFSEPLRVRKPLPVGARPSTWDDPQALTQPEATTLDRWFQPFGEPVRQPRNRFAYLAAGAFDSTVIWPSAETVTLDKWFCPLSEPLRVKPPLPVGAAPSFWIDPNALTFPESTTLDRWFQPFSEPVRYRARRAHLQAGLYDGTTTWPQAVQLDWYGELSRPQFLVPRLQSEGEFGPLFLLATQAEALEWWLAWPEQILFRQRQAYLQAGMFDGTTVWPQRSRGRVTASDALVGLVTGSDSVRHGASGSNSGTDSVSGSDS
ncbi:MAG: hypothetical protein L0312_12770 [Acidobacteria bacterium]|nr:hypothetical protein [Acidobacteriota bacterium]